MMLFSLCSFTNSGTATAPPVALRSPALVRRTVLLYTHHLITYLCITPIAVNVSNNTAPTTVVPTTRNIYMMYKGGSPRRAAVCLGLRACP